VGRFFVGFANGKVVLEMREKRKTLTKNKLEN
jgi:hypothetical protein